MSTPKEIARRKVNRAFEEALDGKIAEELTENAQKVWAGPAFGVTVGAAIRMAPQFFDDLATKRYVLRNVRLIARVCQAHRAKAGSKKISEDQIKRSVDLVIRQARFGKCPDGSPMSGAAGKSCAAYGRIGDLDV